MKEPRIATWKTGHCRGWTTVSIPNEKEAVKLAMEARVMGNRLLIRTDPNNVEDAIQKERFPNTHFELGRQQGSDTRLRAIFRAYPNAPEVRMAGNNEGDVYSTYQRYAMVRGFHEASDALGLWPDRLSWTPYYNWSRKRKGALQDGAILQYYMQDTRDLDATRPRKGRFFYNAIRPNQILIFGWDVHEKPVDKVMSSFYADECVRMITEYGLEDVVWFDKFNGPLFLNQFLAHIDRQPWDEPASLEDPRDLEDQKPEGGHGVPRRYTKPKPVPESSGALTLIDSIRKDLDTLERIIK